MKSILGLIFLKCVIYFLDNSDITLPAVDPRTISPSGNNGLEAAGNAFDETNENNLETEHTIIRNSFDFNPINDVDAKVTQKKLVIKAKRSIKPKVIDRLVFYLRRPV